MSITSITPLTTLTHLTSRVSLRLAKRPSAQFANSQTRLKNSRTPFKRRSATGLRQFKQGYYSYKPRRSILTSFAVAIFFPTIRLTQENKKITTDELLTRTNFQRFLNQVPHLSFKKLIVLMLSLLQDLHTMSLLKSVPEGLKPQECKHTKLHEPPPVPYVPTKDEVQKEVSRLCSKPSVQPQVDKQG